MPLKGMYTETYLERLNLPMLACGVLIKCLESSKMHQEMAIGGRQRRFLPQTANSIISFTSVRHVTIGSQAMFQRHH